MKSLTDCFEGEPMTIGTSTTSFQFHTRLSSLFKSWYFSIFPVLYDLLDGQMGKQYPLLCSSFLFLHVYNYDVWSVVFNFVVSLNRKIP